MLPPLSFLGCRIEIDSDDPQASLGLASVYSSVAVDPKPVRLLQARLRSTGPLTAELDLPSGVVAGRGVASSGRVGAGAAVAFALFHEVARQVREALVLHAGCVSFGAGAVLLVAPSHAGKTTLTTALALRGAAFLSDEAAPLDRQHGMVLPFPRAVGLRPGPLRSWPALAEALQHSVMVTERGGREKHLVDLLARGVARSSVPAAPRHVVFLSSAAGSNAPASSGRWRIELDAPAPGVARALAALPGVRSVRPDGTPEEPALRIEVDPGTRFARALDDAVAAERRIVVRVVEDLAAPDYSARPCLARLSPSEGVIRLVRFLENGAGSALFREEMGGNAGKLLVELARLVDRAQHWQLSQGDLEARCELVEGLA